jgi:hypothetical protein
LSSLLITSFIFFGVKYANRIINAALEIKENPKAMIIIERVLFHVRKSLNLQVYEEIIRNTDLESYISTNKDLWIAQHLDFLLASTCTHFKQLGFIFKEYTVKNDAKV